MAAAVSRSQMNGWYKIRYGEKNNLLPESAQLQRDFPFEKRAKVGKSYNEPVKLRASHGVTFKGGANIGTVYDLQSPISPQWEEASIQGTEITLREQIAVGAIAAAVRGEGSFGDVVDETVLGLDESHRFYLEAGMIYGGSSIGEIESVSGSGTTRTWIIKKASWAPGLWAYAEGMKIDCYSTVGGTLRTTSGATITSIDPDARSIVVTGVDAELTNCVANDVLEFYLADGQLFAGFDKVITNTGSLHGISAATYMHWKGSVFDAQNSALTMGMLGRATTRATVRGLRGEFRWYVNTFSWNDLQENENALRRYAESTGREYVQGADEIAFKGTNGSKVSIRAHEMIKAGEAFGVQPKSWLRGGECDLTDDVDGTNKNFFHEVPGKSGREYRNFSSQFFLCRAPSRQVKIKNIVSPGLA